MAFCGNCGASVADGTTFCGACGKPIGAAATAVAPASGGTPGATAAPAATSSGMTSNVAAALTYLVGWITAVVFLVLEPYNKDKFVRFHAFQSLFFNIGMIVFWIPWTILTGIITHLLPLMGFVFLLLDLLIGLAIFCAWLYLMYQAYSNKQFKLPFIGDFAAKQAGV